MAKEIPTEWIAPKTPTREQIAARVIQRGLFTTQWKISTLLGNPNSQFTKSCTLIRKSLIDTYKKKAGTVITLEHLDETINLHWGPPAEEGYTGTTPRQKEGREKTDSIRD